MHYRLELSSYTRTRQVAILCLTAMSLAAIAQGQHRSSGQTTSQSQQTSQSSSPGTTGGGTLSGRLTGGGMDGATVTATNAATGASQTAVTDASGAFSIPNLAPGSYKMSIRLSPACNWRRIR